MNYNKIYDDIVNFAKSDAANRTNGYFEKHHILPKSLGGIDDENNLVKLTAREHFICHWLLVKMYDKGTVERQKMLCALWRMRSQSNTHATHYVNARAYEKLRIEFANTVREMMSKNQSGSNNSQFGTKWYTNSNTGESKKFKEAPIETCWLEGRNLFNGQTQKIKNFTHKQGSSISRNDKLDIKAKTLWDEYHSGNYTSFREFCSITKKTSQPNLVLLFKNHIPLAKTIIKGRSHNNKSNKNLVGVYE